MSLTVNTKTYNNDVPRTADSMRYLGPAHTLSNNDVIELTRIAAKPTADFAGKARARFKLTRGATNGTTYLGDNIVDMTISTCVGTAESEMDLILADLASYFATASAESFFQDLKIVQ